METEPVTSWADDYDIFDPGFVTDPYPVWKDLRDECPVPHTERWGGSYMPTTYADVSAVARNAEDFTSFEVSVAPIPAAYDEAGNRRRSIISSDAPDHLPERRLILPFFAPRAVERYRESTRDLCRHLIRGFIENGSVDAGSDYARQIPPRVIAEILGIDPEKSDEFTYWVQCVLEFSLKDPELREKYRLVIQEFFISEVEKRRDNPGDDLISVLLASELNGEPVPLHIVLANVGLMLIAGIDTTWSSIGSALWHLAAYPEDRRRLVAEPELLPVAIEEPLESVFAGIDGPTRQTRHLHRRVPGRQRRAGHSVVPGRESRPCHVRESRGGHHRSREEPSRRLRSRTSPMRQLEPGSNGNAGRHRGIPADDPRVRTLRPWRRDLGRWPSEGSTRSSHQVPAAGSPVDRRTSKI